MLWAAIIIVVLAAAVLYIVLARNTKEKKLIREYAYNKSLIETGRFPSERDIDEIVRDELTSDGEDE